MEVCVLSAAVGIVGLLFGICYVYALLQRREPRLTYARSALLSGIGSFVFHFSL